MYLLTMILFYILPRCISCERKTDAKKFTTVNEIDRRKQQSYGERNVAIKFIVTVWWIQKLNEKFILCSIGLRG